MKEKDKLLFAKLLLKITLVMILVSVGLKLLGFNYFEADQNNKIFLFIANIADYEFSIFGYKDNHIKGILIILMMFIQAFIIFRLSCKNKNMKVYYFTALLFTAVGLFTQIFIYDIL